MEKTPHSFQDLKSLGTEFHTLSSYAGLALALQDSRNALAAHELPKVVHGSEALKDFLIWYGLSCDVLSPARLAWEEAIGKGKLASPKFSFNEIELSRLGAPPALRIYLRTADHILKHAEPHELVAIALFAEDDRPLNKLFADIDVRTSIFDERIALAPKVLDALCGGSSRKWREAYWATDRILLAKLALWDALSLRAKVRHVASFDAFSRRGLS